MKKYLWPTKAVKEAFIAQELLMGLFKPHDQSGTHLFGKNIVVDFDKETSIKLDDSYHKPEKVTPRYVNCFSYNDDYFAYVLLCFLLPGYLEIGLPVLR